MPGACTHHILISIKHGSHRFTSPKRGGFCQFIILYWRAVKRTHSRRANWPFGNRKRRRSRTRKPRKPREHSPISVSVWGVMRIRKEITKDVSLTKQPTFRDATTGFPAKWRLRNERRNSILMTCQYPHLGRTSDWWYRERNLLQPIRSTAQIWAMTRHQYGIPALVSQTSFLRRQRFLLFKRFLLTNTTQRVLYSLMITINGP